MNPFETFTDEDITERLSVPMIIDAFWANEYGSEVPLITREVGCSLMYLVRKYGPMIPHDLLLQAVHEHTELSKKHCRTVHSKRCDNEHDHRCDAGCR